MPNQGNILVEEGDFNEFDQDSNGMNQLNKSISWRHAHFEQAHAY